MELDSFAEINSTYPDGVSETGGVVVRAEEALIVTLVLVLWVAAIALFFNRWGKIRMLEPYQPKFQQQHRQSCAIVEPNPVQHRTCSKFNIHCVDHAVHQNGCQSFGVSRSRQNSVFVGSSTSLLPSQNVPRRAKSAFDIHTVVLAECNLQNRVDEEPITLSLVQGGEIARSACPIQRERGMSICHFDRTEAVARPLQRERGMSICHFDRTEAVARPLQRERGMSICQFDRTDTGQLKVMQRERGRSTCNFDRPDSGPCKALQRERGMSVCHFDRQTPSCSKTTEIHSYKATCV